MPKDFGKDVAFPSADRSGSRTVILPNRARASTHDQHERVAGCGAGLDVLVYDAGERWIRGRIFMDRGRLAARIFHRPADREYQRDDNNDYP